MINPDNINLVAHMTINGKWKIYVYISKFCTKLQQILQL